LITAWSDSLSTMQGFLDSNGYRVTNNYQRDGTLFSTYANIYWPGNNSIPTNYLIDRDGRVRFKDHFVTAAVWGDYIEELL